jgi:hypothetical protein
LSNHTEEVLRWVERLTNLDVDRARDGLDVVRSWNLSHVEKLLLESLDLDTAVAAVLLAEAVRDLSAQGVPENKLMKKLRDARTQDQFWPVWAEIRSAAILIGHPDADLRLEMEADRARGRHADYRLIYPDGDSIEVEFKAIGYSEAELAWHREADEKFDELAPPIGLVSAHGWIGSPMRISRLKRERSWKHARRLSDKIAREFPNWSAVNGISIVGHYTEEQYLARLRSRVEDALAQLSAQSECWVAIWWGNGAPIASARDILTEINAPTNVEGLIFIGQAVAVPWSEISIYICQSPRGVDLGERHVSSTVDDHLAKLMLDRFDASSGVRPTLLRARGPSGATLMRRNGRRRIDPFNLLFDADPRVLSGPVRPPSPVQDVYLDM